MAIEIKQLLIKSTLTDEQEPHPKEVHQASESLRDELLTECRRLMLELLQDKGMR